MNRTANQNWLIVLGLGGWWLGHLGLRELQPASWPWLASDLVRTTGLAVFLAVVVIGVWNALKQ